MPNSRVKGQDVEIAVLVDSTQEDSLTNVRNFEVAFKLERTQEGYLGETTDRYDEIFRGARMRMEVHFETQDIFAFVKKILDRAQRRDPTISINIKATLNMPNGETPRLVFKDVYFGEIPFNFGSRSDYGAVTLEGECGNVSVITG